MKYAVILLILGCTAALNASIIQVTTLPFAIALPLCTTTVALIGSYWVFRKM